ncbi:serine protease (plasmid) [Pseudomonas silesiensis]|uniref:serine protease n=1 Tax=Pseudomonas silesiensis TaxID=1853130 RepID=UPI0030CE8C3E
MKSLTAGLALCALLTGCNGIPTPFVNDPVYSQFFTVNSGPPLPLLFQGSAIQWNEDYAVTAKHIPFLWRVAHKGRGDVAFFKHKSKTVPQWRSHVAGEMLTAAGLSPFFVSVKGTGKALAARAELVDLNDKVSYGFSNAPIVKGMSGGPVFGEDAKVVGITVGFLAERFYTKAANPEIAGSERFTIFMPYDEILREWNTYARESLDGSQVIPDPSTQAPN